MARERKNKASYGEQSITSLKGPDRVRKRPAVIFGSDDLFGCQHSFIEILANAVDEAREGYGDKIIVTKYSDLSIEVEDFGRGVPLGYNEKEGRWNWELVFCELYAGGKYNNNNGDGAYEYSLGLNGLGATATQYSSEYMTVKSYNGQTLSEIDFKVGKPVSELKVSELEKGGKKYGTVIRWRPDLKVFKEIDIPVEFLSKTLLRQAFINSGVHFILRVEGKPNKFEESEFYYERGVADYMDEIVDGIAITEPVLWKLETKGKDRADLPEYKFKADIAFSFVETGLMEYYHNSSYLDKDGSHNTAVKNAFTATLQKYIEGYCKGVKDDVKKLTFADISDNLAIIINSASTQTSYENQTKKSVNNKFIREALQKFISDNFLAYLMENPIPADKIVQQVLTNKHAREAAVKIKKGIENKIKQTKKIDVSNRVEKFIPCSSKDPEICEVYIVEGDSAATSCKLGRSAEFQAIMPVRGKTINCMKSTNEKIFKSDIIVDLLNVIGCGVESDLLDKDSVSSFNYKNLKWNKIIICTDADEDGYQIRTLLLTMFYKFLPTLINKGHIYIAESPLFEITCGNDTYFAYNEQEKIDILSKLGNKKYTIQRSKGLGENDAKMMWQTTMCPETRRLVAVTPTDAKETEKMFEILLGDAITERKKYIAEYGHLYLANADI